MTLSYVQGRCDVKLEIGLLSRDQAQQLFRKFFPDADDKLRAEFAEQIPLNVLSVAQIQSHLFLHRDSATEAVRKLREFLHTVRSFETQLRQAREREKCVERMKRAPLLHNL
ncbi:hypothetical protein TcBrA4_0019960 [Trypanosoma cruzi]|nr:hypothetical protein TcBrA4_0019960 [Trypanosoma cruzi]